jgi:phosphoribosyl-ATP pyrophosphohydrolase
MPVRHIRALCDSVVQCAPASVQEAPQSDPSMPRKKAHRKALKIRQERESVAGVHALDRLYGVIDSRKGADPGVSHTARLFSRGRQQIAKKLGEEAIETLIEGVRGDKPKLVSESADMLYHLLALWASLRIKPAAIWAELEKRDGLSRIVEKA